MRIEEEVRRQRAARLSRVEGNNCDAMRRARRRRGGGGGGELARGCKARRKNTAARGQQTARRRTQQARASQAFCRIARRTNTHAHRGSDRMVTRFVFPIERICLRPFTSSASILCRVLPSYRSVQAAGAAMMPGSACKPSCVFPHMHVVA